MMEEQQAQLLNKFEHDVGTTTSSVEPNIEPGYTIATKIQSEETRLGGNVWAFYYE